MATLNIKDPEVHKLAKELARRRGTSATGAVREALREALGRENAQDATLIDDILAIGRRSAARPEPFLTEAELYDDAGLPR